MLQDPPIPLPLPVLGSILCTSEPNNLYPLALVMYYVCRMSDTFQWEGLRSTTDENYADQLAEYYSEQFPNAYIDVLTYEEYHGGPIKWAAMAIK